MTTRTYKVLLSELKATPNVLPAGAKAEFTAVVEAQQSVWESMSGPVRLTLIKDIDLQAGELFEKMESKLKDPDEQDREFEITPEGFTAIQEDGAASVFKDGAFVWTRRWHGLEFRVTGKVAFEVLAEDEQPTEVPPSQPGPPPGPNPPAPSAGLIREDDFTKLMSHDVSVKNCFPVADGILLDRRNSQIIINDPRLLQSSGIVIEGEVTIKGHSSGVERFFTLADKLGGTGPEMFNRSGKLGVRVNNREAFFVSASPGTLNNPGQGKDEWAIGQGRYPVGRRFSFRFIVDAVGKTVTVFVDNKLDLLAFWKGTYRAKGPLCLGNANDWEREGDRSMGMNGVWHSLKVYGIGQSAPPIVQPPGAQLLHSILWTDGGCDTRANVVEEGLRRLKASTLVDHVIWCADITPNSATQRVRPYCAEGGRFGAQPTGTLLRNLDLAEAIGQPVIILVENDYAADHGRTEHLGSCGWRPGQAGQDMSKQAFYSSARLLQTRLFMQTLLDRYPNLSGFQFSIEARVREAEPYYSTLAEWLRHIGYKGFIVTNFLGEAYSAFKNRRQAWYALNALDGSSDGSWQSNLQSTDIRRLIQYDGEDSDWQQVRSQLLKRNFSLWDADDVDGTVSTWDKYARLTGPQFDGEVIV